LRSVADSQRKGRFPSTVLGPWLRWPWLGENRVVVINAIPLMSTTVVTAGLGFVYWWLAARLFPPEAVGLASAGISAMSLIGNVSLFGLGTLLMGELPRQPANAAPLVVTALLLVGGASALLGLLFAMAVPVLSANLVLFLRGPGSKAIFVLGVMLTGIVLVLDDALVGLFRARLQLLRNALFALIKLLALLVSGLCLTNTGMAIYAAWALGNLLSLTMLWPMRTTVGRAGQIRPQWTLLRSLGRAAIQHHVLNLLLQAPGLLMPVVVAVLLSPAANASFYIAWMLANVIFLIPNALTMVLYAVGSANPTELAQRLRLTLKLSFPLVALASGLLLVMAPLMLRFFGSSYAQQGAWCLRLLALAAFPVVVKSHYLAICRVRQRVTVAIRLMLVGSFLELLLAALGAILGALTGLALGWMVAMCLEAALAAPLVYRMANLSTRQSEPNAGSPMSPAPLERRLWHDI
jgi:O-antigen/teichoic acid export membrane protein